MTEQNEQEFGSQNQYNLNGGSDMVRQDGGVINGNTNNNEGNVKENSRKGIDLLGSTYEDAIWNSNLDGDKKDKNSPKNYPGKKWRNARAIVLIINIIFSMLGRLTIGLELLFTILLVVFIILWIKTVRSPENQEIINKNNIGKRLKGIIVLYAIFTGMYVLYDIHLISNVELEYTIDDVYNYTEKRLSSVDLNFYNDNSVIINEEIIKVANEYAGCNCFGNSATENEKNSFNSTEFENIVGKIGFNMAIEAFLYGFEQDMQFGKIVERHEEEIRTELIKSANNIIGRDCFGSYEMACDLSNINLKDLWTKTYTDALNKIAPKVDNGERK